MFANVVLVDEVNRASPRTAGRAARADGRAPGDRRRRHPRAAGSVLLIATQNPFGTTGTFPLPESQLDRFGLVLTMGLPGRDAEREILTGDGRRDVLAVARSR